MPYDRVSLNPKLIRTKGYELEPSDPANVDYVSDPDHRIDGVRSSRSDRIGWAESVGDGSAVLACDSFVEVTKGSACACDH